MKKNKFFRVLLGVGVNLIMIFTLLSNEVAQSRIEKSSTGITPAARYSAGNTYDEVNGRLILFKGAENAPATLAKPDVTTQVRVSEAYGKLPLSFEANQGQTDSRVRFLSRGSGYTLFLTSTEAVLALRKSQAVDQKHRSLLSPLSNKEVKGEGEGTVLRMKLVGASPTPRVAGLEELPGKSNYFIGNDPKKWRTNVPNYARVQYQEVYPGVNLVYYGNQRQLEYDFVVAPGADPKAIKLAFEGAQKLRTDAQGNLVLLTKGGEVHFQKPLVYQEIDGARREILGHYVMRGNDRVGFQVAAYDPARPLVIDPVLVYSTYLGGNAWEIGQGIALDASGSAYVTGKTASTIFPTANPLQPAYGGSTDVFVAKLNSTGSALVYSTYLGGSGYEEGSWSIAIDTLGSAYVTGLTNSTNFPIVDPLQPTYGGNNDTFVAKLNPTGSALTYSTYLGGSSGEWGYGVVVDASGSAYVIGVTASDRLSDRESLAGGLRWWRGRLCGKVESRRLGSRLLHLPRWQQL